MGKLTFYCDGGSRGNPGPGAAAFVAIDSNGRIVAKRGYFLGYTTNNQAEYQAVIYALSFVAEKNLESLQVFIIVDSELVARQLQGVYRIKDKKLQGLALKVKNLEREILPMKVIYRSVPRRENKLADLLVNKTLNGKKDIV